MPRLFSFLSAEGHGVEAYFHGQYLLIEASGGAGCVSRFRFLALFIATGVASYRMPGAPIGRYRATVHFPRALPVRCWAALAVEATATEARLYLDGVLCDVAPLALPAVPLPLAFCCVGTNPPAAMVGLQRRRRQSALFAALGPVYVFREPLGAPALARLAARGADHVPCFGAGAPPRGRAGGYVHGGGSCVSAAEAAALDAELAPKLLQAFHPRLRLAGRAAPDVSPAAPCWTQPGGATSAGTGRAALQPPGPLLVAGAGRAGGGPPRGATALGGVCTAHRAPLADALWSLGEGGLAALLPLVPPALEGPPGLAPSAGRVGAGGAAAAADAAFAAAAAVRCIAEAAHAHPAALHALARAGAPRALAAALPPLWAAAAAAAPDGDAGVDAAQTAVAEAVAALALAAHAHEPLARQAYATLVLDLRPWHGACRAAQRAVLRAAASAAHAHPAAFRALGGLQRLLDSIARHLAAPPQHEEDDEPPSPEHEQATSPTSPSRNAEAASAASAALVDDAFVAAELLCGAGGGDACWRDDMRALVDFTASSAALPPGAPPPGAPPGIGTSGHLAAGAPSIAEAARARPQAARALLLLYRLVSAPAAAARAAALDGLVAANGAELLLVLLRQEACGAAEVPPATPTSPPPATTDGDAIPQPNAPPTPSTSASGRARPSFSPAARRARGSAAGAAAELSVSGDIVAGCVRLLAALLAAGRLASRPGGVSPEAALKALRFAFENAPAAFATPGPYEALLRGALGGAAAAALAGGAGGAGGGMLADALAAAMAQRASAASASSTAGAHGGSALAQPALLRALLPALPFAPPALRRRALRDLLMLCAADAAARAALAALPESPDWLVALMLCDDDGDVPMPPDATQRGEPATTAEAALAFLRVVLEAGLRARGGWRACEAALLSLRAAGAASPQKAPAAAAMAAQLVQGLLAFAAGELRGQTAPEAGAGARAGAALGWAAGAPAAAAAGSAGASASAATAAAATAAAAEARAATVLDTVTENALALLAIAEGALRAATALPDSDAGDASADDRSASERAAAAFAAYGPDAARVLAGGRERAALAAAAEAEASRAARAAGIPLPEPAASASHPSDADPASDGADGGPDGVDADGGGFGAAPGPPPATPGRGATGFIRALTSGVGAPERASSFDGAADAVARTLAAAAAAAAEAAAAAAARAGPWGAAAGRNARRVASEAEPFAAPAAAPRWRAALGAASELAEELVHGAEKLRRSHPPGGTKPPATTAAAAARTGAALLASDVALLLLLRVALAAMRADAADGATSAAQDPPPVLALDHDRAPPSTPQASQLSRREQPLSDAPAPPAAASRHSRLEAVLHRLVAPLLSERPEGPRAVRALAVAAVLYDELWAAARACGLRPGAPEAALEFRVWRAGLGTASATAALASFSTATPGSPASPGGLGNAGGNASAACEEHLRALVVPFAALLQHWRAALAPALADAAGRAPLASGPQSEDAPFAAAASGGLGAVTLRGASRCAPRDSAALFATPAWAAAFAGRACAAALLAASGGGGGGGVGLARAFAPPAARARASEAAALRDGHAAAWAAFRRAWGHPDWAAGAGAAVRVGAALSADAPRRAAHAAAAAAAAVAGARAWRRLARRLAEAGVLFAGGPGGGPPSAPDRWRLDETEDASRARRRFKRDYRPGIAEPAASGGAPRPSADANAGGMTAASGEHAGDSESAQPRASGGAGGSRRAPRWSAGGTPSSAHAAPPARRGGGDAHPALDDVAEGAEDAADDVASEHGGGSRRASGDAQARSLRTAPSGRLSATTLASMPHDEDYDFEDAADGGADAAAALARAASDAEAAAAAMRGGQGSDEAPLAVADVIWVTPAAAVEGVLALTASRLTFTPAQQQRQDKESADAAQSGALRRPRSWALSALLQIHARRYLLRRSALELFFVDRGAAFFDLGSGGARRSFSRALLGARPPALAAVYADASRASLLRPASALLRPELTARWQRRELSNFEYLMELNTLAGRTYNDVTQWPVFPWVLADYTSPVLDLTNPATFRDLSKPVGALNPERAARFRERYAGWDDPAVPPFHYGSHYSSAGTVLYYMLRVEPFTRLAAQLQGGRLDVADRLFFDVKATWDGVLSSMADVKELTPEWFYLPDMFVNANGVDLGERQTGERLGDVALPPWARDAHDFVAQHRAALESDAVSAQLHRWIDLVFGDKQRGVAAVAAQNVFYYLTYEGAVDVDAIDDPVLLKATQDQIAHFGQTPSQLLQAPHPPRWAASLVKQPLFAAPAAAATYLLPVPPAAAAPALALLAQPGGFVVVTPQLQLLRHGLRGARAPDGRGAPFAHTPPALPAPGAAAEAIKALSGALWGAAAAFTRGAAAAADAATLAAGRPPPPPRAAAPGPRAASAWTPVPGMPSAAAALAEPPAARLVLLTRDGTHLIVGGAADGSLRAFLAADGALRCVQSAGVHRGPVCALAAAPDGGVMAAASRDGTVTTWLLGAPAAEGGPAAVPDGADGERQVAPQELTAAEHAAAATAAAAFAAVAAAEADEDEAAEAGNVGEGSSGVTSPSAAEPEPDAAVSTAQVAGDAAALALGVVPPPPPLRGPLHFLRGCPEPPAAVAVSCSLDCVAAACPTAGLALFSLLRGRLTRRVPGAPGELLALSREGYAVVWDPRARLLRSVSLNGALAAQAAPPGDEGPVAAMLASADGRTLVTGSGPDAAHPGSVGRVTLRALPTLRELYRFAVPEGAAVTAMLLLEGDTLLLVATSGGATLVITDPMAPPPRPMWAAQAARQLAKKLPMQYD